MASTTHPNTTPNDTGSVLPLTLVFMTFGALVVTALLSFAITLFINRPPIEERSDSFEAVQSAMNMAVTMQRANGPEGCFEHTDNNFDVNNRNVNVSCTVLENQDALGGRYGIVTTSNVGDASANNASVSIQGGALVRNDVFVQAGSVAEGSAGVQLLHGAVVNASTSVDNGLSAFRYTTTDPTVSSDVSATPTCLALYGANAVEELFTAPDFASTANITATADLPALATGVQLAPQANVRLLGAIVTDSGGSVLLDRDVLASGELAVASLAPETISQVQACFQVDIADTDPTYVPDGFTFCGSPIMDPENFDQVASLDGVNCVPEAWWNVAGWKSSASTTYITPMLPQIPTYQRSAVPRQVGTSNCFVLYPGRYTSELILDGGSEYYFASGVYLFEQPITVSGDARVVGGEGEWAGCTFDAEASFLPGSPQSHDITGKGVTFLLAGDANLVVNNASVRLNDRVGTSSTRASSGISLMTINQAVSTPELTIPANDRVLLPGFLPSEVAANPAYAEDISTYSNTPIVGGLTLAYSASTLGHDDLAIDATLNGSSTNTNRVIFGSAVYTPNAGVSVMRTAAGDAFGTEFRGGVTATTVSLDLPSGATSPAEFGEESPSTYVRVRLEGDTTFGGRTYRTTVMLEVDSSDRYAINSWVNSSEASAAAATNTVPATSAPAITATTTTIPAVTTTTTPPATPPAANNGPLHPTLVGPSNQPIGNHPEVDYCASAQTSWTHDFGTGTWLGEFWNFNSSAYNGNLGAAIFVGAPDAYAYVSEINEQWNSDSGPAGQINYFGAMYTATINVPANCTMDLQVGGDDGYALYVDGNLEASHWAVHATTYRNATVTLQPGENLVQIRYYERTGGADIELEWKIS